MVRVKREGGDKHLKLGLPSTYQLEAFSGNPSSGHEVRSARISMRVL